MRLRFEQLTSHLTKGLAPLYLIYGDEPLLVQEAADAVRSTARGQGYSERECFTVEPGFDWNHLWQLSTTPSLFADRRILELRLEHSRPGDPGSKVLVNYAARPAEDAILLITCGKLDAAAQKSRWFKALDTTGITIPVWPVERRQLPAWIERRLLIRGLRPTPEANALLAERVEGNLLAAAQAIDKLHVLFGSGSLSSEQLLTVIDDSARFSIYDLVDAALDEQIQRTLRIIHGLQGEGIEPALVNWALHREIRLLALLSFAIGQGQPLETALTHHKVWEKRKPLLRRALQRLSNETCQRLLRYCAWVDRLIKGVTPGDPWDALRQLSLKLAGLDLHLDQTEQLATLHDR